MDTLMNIDRYRVVIKQLLSQYATYKPSYGEVEVETVFDLEQDRYLVLAIGWDGKQRVYGCSIHLDIRDCKIWIQVNNTELDIGQDLVNVGVPKEDIVVGFQPLYMRQFSGYAIV